VRIRGFLRSTWENTVLAAVTVAVRRGARPTATISPTTSPRVTSPTLTSSTVTSAVPPCTSSIHSPGSPFLISTAPSAKILSSMLSSSALAKRWSHWLKNRIVCCTGSPAAWARRLRRAAMASNLDCSCGTSFMIMLNIAGVSTRTSHSERATTVAVRVLARPSICTSPKHSESPMLPTRLPPAVASRRPASTMYISRLLSPSRTTTSSGKKVLCSMCRSSR